MPLVLHEEISDQVAKITLNDPDHLNAMSEEMALEFAALVSRLRERTRPYRALILAGAGRAFSAGGDLEMLEAKASKPLAQNEAEMLSFYKSFLCIRDLQVPLIAAVHGHAVGAGLCLACACDFRIISRSAKLGFTFTKLGLYPGMGATYFLPQVIGQTRAAELMLTGRIIEGEEIEEIKIASKVVPREDVLQEAESLADEFLLCGPKATKNLLVSLRGDDAQLVEALLNEARQQSICYASKEFLEGVRATIEKRVPDWE